MPVAISETLHKRNFGFLAFLCFHCLALSTHREIFGGQYRHQEYGDKQAYADSYYYGEDYVGKNLPHHLKLVLVEDERQEYNYCGHSGCRDRCNHLVGTLYHSLFTCLALVKMLIHILKHYYGSIQNHTKPQDKACHGHHVKGKAAKVHGKYCYKNCHRQRYADYYCTPDTAQEHKKDTDYKTKSLEHSSPELGKGIADLGAVVPYYDKAYILGQVILKLLDFLIKTVCHLHNIGTSCPLDRDIDTRHTVYRCNRGLILVPHENLPQVVKMDRVTTLDRNDSLGYLLHILELACGADQILPGAALYVTAAQLHILLA